MQPTDLPLFPLSSVLFPEGTLNLRIFERRYLDMIRDCARDSKGFGVCLILEGQEVGEPSMPAAVGTLARIVDFHTTDDGLLGILASGNERFHVRETRVRDNGLIHARVDWFDECEIQHVPPECGLLATILERFHDQVGGEYSRIDRARYDDAAWVGYRLAEALPLEESERQLLLQTSDPIERLTQLMHFLPRFQTS
ncbi:MAG: LON peptidase substrate-binding domain-containing protein [Dokdonella sp.]